MGKGKKGDSSLLNMASSLIGQLKIKEVFPKEEDSLTLTAQKVYMQSAEKIREHVQKTMKVETWNRIVLQSTSDELFCVNTSPCNLSGKELILEFAIRAIISRMALLFDMRNSEIIELLPEDEFIMDECVTEGNGFFDPSNLHIDEQ